MTKNNHDVGTVVTNAIRNAEDKFGQPPQIMFWCAFHPLAFPSTLRVSQLRRPSIVRQVVRSRKL